MKIIDDILDVSRVITGKFRLDARPVDLVSIAREALEVVRPSATAKKIALELSTHAPESVLVADPERLQQVIWNLLSNAVKFTDSGGKIQLSVRAKDSNLVLQVRDDGKGIDPQHLKAGRARHWGLTNMRERAQQIGSELRLWSEVGVGTEVELRIPGALAYGPAHRRGSLANR